MKICFLRGHKCRVCKWRRQVWAIKETGRVSATWEFLGLSMAAASAQSKTMHVFMLGGTNCRVCKWRLQALAIKEHVHVLLARDQLKSLIKETDCFASAWEQL